MSVTGKFLSIFLIFYLTPFITYSFFFPILSLASLVSSLLSLFLFPFLLRRLFFKFWHLFFTPLSFYSSVYLTFRLLNSLCVVCSLYLVFNFSFPPLQMPSFLLFTFSFSLIFARPCWFFLIISSLFFSLSSFSTSVKCLCSLFASEKVKSFFFPASHFSYALIHFAFFVSERERKSE